MKEWIVMTQYLILLRVVALTLFLLLVSCSSKGVYEDALIAPDGEGGVSMTESPPLEMDTFVPAEPELANSAGASDAGAGIVELEPVYFPFDSAVFTNESLRTLRKNARWLQENTSVQIQLEGHCDERGTVEYNLALGERRARVTKLALIKLGIPKERISIISFGEERPADPDHNERAWAKNRRTEFVVTSS